MNPGPPQQGVDSEGPGAFPWAACLGDYTTPGVITSTSWRWKITSLGAGLLAASPCGTHELHLLPAGKWQVGCAAFTTVDGGQLFTFSLDHSTLWYQQPCCNNNPFACTTLTRVIEECIAPQSECAFPESWAPQLARYSNFEVAPHSDEWNSVLCGFDPHSGRGIEVSRLIRIQNVDLYEDFCYQKKRMQRRVRADANAAPVEPVRLFHGTGSAGVASAIAQDGFDIRLCGVHGTVYGCGTYFSPAPKICNSYASPDRAGAGKQHMFACQVLVGQTCKGDRSMKRPPPSFDSTVDRTESPMIVVTYHNHQAFPEYLIEYGCAF